MNELQKGIFEVIKSILSNDYINQTRELETGSWSEPLIHNSAIRYGILNYVAKFSLANDNYFITQNCLTHLRKNGLLNSKGLLRAKKGARYKFIFEHPVPSNVIGDLLYANKDNKDMMLKILKETDCVTIMTYEENFVLIKNGFADNMPHDWKILKDDPFARYDACGFDRPETKVPVYGALAR